MMRRAAFLFALALVPSGCGLQDMRFLDRFNRGAADETQASGETGTEAEAGAPLSALSTAPPPPAGAATAEAFDTTLPEEREAAVRAAQEMSGERLLGETVTSLGDPTIPGFWMETPLVSEARQGRVENPLTGKSVTVELRPSGGAPGSGSRLSLAAFRLLGADLRSLVTLKVYAL
ncbi:hypothetical protein SAMN05216257_10598 [Meinhardsimonia xiamenensis]|jgi:hypothetical protein|uniref:D-galactarate dehydratase n=2 Tax=Meinhardsimonia xiamenensis TaxID=990712 RepID=A0A1G9F9S3_9RHOB|nr:hypothetical protein LV81_00205 [Meinhardsimonia xiamenensis]SDK85126.1 hypothetical protein SAMN05216257_10598 [Meinhardsimonia xiamenensis]